MKVFHIAFLFTYQLAVENVLQQITPIQTGETEQPCVQRAIYYTHLTMGIGTVIKPFIECAPRRI